MDQWLSLKNKFMHDLHFLIFKSVKMPISQGSKEDHETVKVSNTLLTT